MPSGGTRSRKGSCCGGSALCTASSTLSYACGPVLASTARQGAVEDPAGVHDDEVRALMLARELIALGAQARDDALGIDQRLGAAERYKADFRPARRRGRCIYRHVNPF